MKPYRSVDQPAHSVSRNEEERQRLFFDKMKDFPCSFNLGHSDLNIGDKQYRGFNITEPDLRKYNCEYIKQNLEETKGEDFEDIIWRVNLLTRVHAELGDLSVALRLNKKIVKKSGSKNLVALGNLAFLFYLNKEVEKVNDALKILNKVKSSPKYKDLKIRAILEQAYEYRKFGGANNLLCSIALFDFALPLWPQDERLQFMRAMVYRRCTHFGIYIEDSKNIDRHQFALIAATELFRLGNEATQGVIRSAALIELAYLNHNDYKFDDPNLSNIDDVDSSGFSNSTMVLNKYEWFGIIGDNDWKKLCFKSIETGGANLSEKVLKIAGQLFRYFDTDENLQWSELFLMGAIEIKSTNRAHHHLGLTLRKMAINFERWCLLQEEDLMHTHLLQNNNVAALNFSQRDWMQQWPTSQNSNFTDINHLPSPLENEWLQNRDKYLRSGLKVPGGKIKPFSMNNPYTYMAVEHFKQAIEISHEQNIPVFYDLAYIYAQMGLFDESKKTCLKLIEACNNHYSGMQYLTYVANAYNLYGMCCSLEADMTEDDARKMALINESEEMLIQAVRMASNLAVGVPELTMAATDLWEACSTLKRKFNFEGSPSSRKKLFKLCELMHDSRHIETVREILSKHSSEWKNAEALQKCLERHLNLGDIDGALMFLDMISLHPESNFTRHNNPTVQQLMFEVTKRTLSRILVQIRGGDSLTLSDQIWKRMFQESFDAENNNRKYDIVIVQDVYDNNEPKPGTRSDRFAECLKDILTKVCGLNVVKHHEVALPGGLILEQDINIVSKSHAAIFVLACPWDESLTLEACLERKLTFGEAASDSAVFGAHSGTVNLTHSHGRDSLSNLYPARMENAVPEDQTDNLYAEAPLSNLFRYIISTCTYNHLKERKPAHIVPVCLGEMTHDHLPGDLQGLSSLHLSDTDIDRLSSALQDDVCDETVNLIMTVFKAVIRQY